MSKKLLKFGGNRPLMHTYKKYLWAALILPVFLGSCRHFLGKRVKGNGTIKTEDRSVSGFKEVDASGVSTVFVSQGDQPSVKIECDENLLPYVEVIQEGDKIYIREKNDFNLRPSVNINVYVTSPVYDRIAASGACDIIGRTKISNPDNLELHVSGSGDIKMEVDAPGLKARLSGSGDVELKGHTKDVDLELTGAASAKCYDLLAENTKVDISGAGDAEVFASVRLDASVSGAGSVSYKGNASSVNQHVSGAGSVNKVN